VDELVANNAKLTNTCHHEVVHFIVTSLTGAKYQQQK